MAAEHGVLVTLEAGTDRQDEVARFLREGLTSVLSEIGTTTWYSYRITESLFGVYATFADAESRRAYLDGEFAKNLDAAAGDILAGPPRVDEIGVVASKAAV